MNEFERLWIPIIIGIVDIAALLGLSIEALLRRRRAALEIWAPAAVEERTDVPPKPAGDEDARTLTRDDD
ncbi:hypothetical protein JW905_10010 [bacterium]|nr:hypothetical protein [candidate division CSSED10-310 bacterium]